MHLAELVTLAEEATKSKGRHLAKLKIFYCKNYIPMQRP